MFFYAVAALIKTGIASNPTAVNESKNNRIKRKNEESVVNMLFSLYLRLYSVGLSKCKWVLSMLKGIYLLS